MITGHTGEPAPASQLDSVNEGGAYLLFSLTAHLQVTDAIDARVARGGGRALRLGDVSLSVKDAAMSPDGHAGRCSFDLTNEDL